jgi:hypothetical protein
MKISEAKFPAISWSELSSRVCWCASLLSWHPCCGSYNRARYGVTLDVPTHRQDVGECGDAANSVVRPFQTRSFLILMSCTCTFPLHISLSSTSISARLGASSPDQLKIDQYEDKRLRILESFREHRLCAFLLCSSARQSAPAHHASRRTHHDRRRRPLCRR